MYTGKISYEAFVVEKSVILREYKLLCQMLREVRQDRAVTQIELAERLGETQSFVSKCERGERRLDIVQLRAFCQALGIGLSGFVTDFERRLRKR